MKQQSFEKGRGIARFLTGALLTAMLVCIFFAPEGSSLRLVLYLLIITLTAALAADICVLCRCPHCNRVIVNGVLVRTSCPHCRRSFTTGKRVKGKK